MSSNDFTIVSYAMGQEYEKSYWSLRAWAVRNKKYKTDFHILPEKGDYYENTRYKPTFILSMLEKHQAPILWLDIDSDIKKDIEEYIGGDEILAPRHENPVHKRYYACCLYFPYNEESLSLVRQWKYLCDNPDYRERGDHSLLVKVLPDTKYFAEGFLTTSRSSTERRQYAIVNTIQSY